jgi:hypothetical protein
MSTGIATNAVILRVLGENILRVLGGTMGKFKRRQRHSLLFCLFLGVAVALLLPAAVSPRANAGSTDYWDSDYLLGSRPRPASEVLSQSQGTLINQPLASNYNLTLALNVASGSQPGAFQPLAVDALFSWTGGTNTTWSTGTNWSPAGPPGAADTAVFNGAFSNQPNLTAVATVGSLLMTDPVAQNVTVTGSALTINGVAGTGILINNTNAFTLTINAPLVVGGDQAWTNSSGNLFTVGGTVALNGNDLTVNGTGNTTISGAISGAVAGSTLTKNDSSTLIVTGNGAGAFATTVNGGTLLINGSGDLGTGTITVNSGGTLGGNSSAAFVGGAITVATGGNLSPGNGGNNTASVTVNALTLSPGANFRVDLNGTAVGTGYDRVTADAGSIFNNSNLIVHVGFATTTSQTFTILHIGGGLGGQQFAQGTQVAGDDGKIYSITYTGDNVILQWTGQLAAVPEPSTWIGGALAIAGLAFTQRRRLRKLIARRCAVGS